jgi:hypothetical protein
MDLTKIVTISGRGGLFKVISSAKNAAIVESLTDKKRSPAFAHEKVSTLEEINIYTTGEERPLKEVFKGIFEKLEGKPAIDPKEDNAKLKAFFLEMVPDFDQEKVYVSDIKKMISWYNLLLAENLLDFTEEEKPAEETAPATTETEKKEEPATEAPEAAPAKKKRAPKSEHPKEEK